MPVGSGVGQYSTSAAMVRVRSSALWWASGDSVMMRSKLSPSQSSSSSDRRACLANPPADAHRQAVADLAIGGELLLAVAFHAGRIRRRPVFDIGGHGARQIQRLVVGFRRQRDDEIEIEPFPILELLECRRLVAGKILAEVGHHGGGERIKLALLDASGFDVERLRKHLLQQAR